MKTKLTSFYATSISSNFVNQSIDPRGNNTLPHPKYQINNINIDQMKTSENYRTESSSYKQTKKIEETAVITKALLRELKIKVFYVITWRTFSTPVLSALAVT